MIRAYERFKGIDTPRDDCHRFDYSDQMRGYEPSNWLTLKRITRIVPISSQDILIDFGCGKGRLIYLAAHYPFKRIIGVEISKPLYDIARKNITQRKKHFKCQDIQLVHADVTKFELPDDFTIAYFFNPFVADLFIQVIQRIHTSLEKNPRQIWVIYKNPKMKNFLDQCPWLEFQTIDHNIAFYRSCPV
jgi:SAM-dependent methyltransferase